MKKRHILTIVYDEGSRSSYSSSSMNRLQALAIKELSTPSNWHIARLEWS